MNELAREVLRKAALDGTKQVYGEFFDGEGGFCAMGVFLYKETNSVDSYNGHHYMTILTKYALTGYETCPLCGCSSPEDVLITHLNDEHELDFLSIANKL